MFSAMLTSATTATAQRAFVSDLTRFVFNGASLTKSTRKCRQIIFSTRLMSEHHATKVAEFNDDDDDEGTTRLFKRSFLTGGVAVLLCTYVSFISTVYIPLMLAVVLVAKFVIGECIAKYRVLETGKFVAIATDTRDIIKKCVRLTSEAHMLARGLVLSRNDVSMETIFNDRFGALLTACFACLTDVTRGYQNALSELDRKCPLVYGCAPSDHLESAEISDELISNVKAAYSLFTDVQSAFILRLSLGLCPSMLASSRTLPYFPAGTLCRLRSLLEEHSRALTSAYRYHVTPSDADRDAVEVSGGNRGEGADQFDSAVSSSVHSMYMQSEVLAMIARLAQNEVLTAAENSDHSLEDSYRRIDEHITLSRYHAEKVELLCSQIQLQLARLQDPGTSRECVDEFPPPAPELQEQDVPEAEPVEDEVLEATADHLQDSERRLREDEDSGETIKRRLNKSNTEDLLKELNSALQRKKQEWDVREARARAAKDGSCVRADTDSCTDAQLSIDPEDGGNEPGDDQGKPTDTRDATGSLGLRTNEMEYLLSVARRPPPPMNRQRPSRNSLRSMMSDHTPVSTEEEKTACPNQSNCDVVDTSDRPSSVCSDYDSQCDSKSTTDVSDDECETSPSKDEEVPTGRRFDPARIGGVRLSSDIASQAAKLALRRRKLASDEIYE